MWSRWIPGVVPAGLLCGPSWILEVVPRVFQEWFVLDSMCGPAGFQVLFLLYSSDSLLFSSCGSR
jgi:hypothetical protein